MCVCVCARFNILWGRGGSRQIRRLQCLSKHLSTKDISSLNDFPALCFRLDEEETIATFSIGYADGYSRQLSGKGVVTTVDGETTGLSLSGFSVFFTDYSVAFYQFYFHYYSLSGFIVFFTDYSVVLSVFFSQLLLAS